MFICILLLTELTYKNSCSIKTKNKFANMNKIKTADKTCIYINKYIIYVCTYEHTN